MTLSFSALLLWGIQALVTSFDFIPVWTPLLFGFVVFFVAFLVSHSRRALAAILGSALLLGGLSLVIQTQLTKPDWLIQAASSEASAKLELSILNRPKAIYANFDRSPVYGVSVSLVSLAGSPASGRGYLIYDGIELQRGQTVALDATLEPAGRNARDAFLAKPSSDIAITKAPEKTQGLLNRLRADYVSKLVGVTPDATALVAGLAIGEIGQLSHELEQQMLTVSLTHLVAVSGSNCAIVVGIAYLIAIGLRFGRVGRAVFSLSALVGYVFLIGPDPSVLRAGVMAASVILMIALGRRTWALNALALACLVLLIADPWLAVEYGFGLSVLATAGILLLAPAVTTRLSERMPMPLAIGLSVTISAQLFCLPLLVQLQPGLPTYSVVANLLAGPMVAPVTVLGMLALVLTPLLPFLVGPISWLASLGTWVIEAIAIFFANLPVAYFPWATGLPATALSLLLIVAVVAWLRSGSVPTRAIGVAAVVVIAVTTISIPAASEILPKSWPVKNWTIVACDVGQGDAIVIRSLGRVAVIDVGADEVLIDKCLTELKIARIDLLVLTHFDFDHVGGLQGLLRSRKISTVIVSGFPDERPATRSSLQALDEIGANVLVADPSLSGVFGEYSWKVLAPTKSAAEAKDSNDASVAMAFLGPRLDILLLGDLGEQGQERIHSDVVELLGGSKSPLVLKVSHHGSNDQFALLHETLRPEIALVSVGEKNGYGHPGTVLLDLLERSGSLVLRTDTSGSVAVGANGDRLTWAGSG